MSNNSGTGFTIPLATLVERGLLTKEDFAKLSKITITQPINLDTIVSDKTYVHDQSTASTNWIIQHNLNKYPSITIEDTSGRIVWGGIQRIDENTIALEFSLPFSGRAYCN